ncbi:MAG: hypothetical protein ABSE90_03245 [Verrucomicrobiota bacterium]|jgi:hypothetical protein
MHQHQPHCLPPGSASGKIFGVQPKNVLDIRMLSYNIVSMNTITKRELTRNPARLSVLKPGERMAIDDRQGGLTVQREKKNTLTAEQIEGELFRICAGCPPVDSLKMMEEES